MTYIEALETIKGERWIGCQEKRIEAINLITNVTNTIDAAILYLQNYKQVQERIEAEMSFDNPNMDVKNLPGLARALEIFREIESGQ